MFLCYSSLHNREWLLLHPYLLAPKKRLYCPWSDVMVLFGEWGRAKLVAWPSLNQNLGRFYYAGIMMSIALFRFASPQKYLFPPILLRIIKIPQIIWSSDWPPVVPASASIHLKLIYIYSLLCNERVLYQAWQISPNLILYLTPYQMPVAQVRYLAVCFWHYFKFWSFQITIFRKMQKKEKKNLTHFCVYNRMQIYGFCS